MDALISIASPVFWGVLLLSVLVFLHEGGHYLAARVCGVRVTEYFLGLPCRARLSFVSKRNGTRFGVTPLLLGGYAMVCGMDAERSPVASRALALIHRHGQLSVKGLALEAGCTEDEALDACVQLLGWGSIALPGDSSVTSELDTNGIVMAPARDREGRTLLDGRSFDRAHATKPGEPWEPPMGEDGFFELERSRTYAGKGFWQRAFILAAGILVNLISGIILLMSIYSLVGVSVTVNVNQIGTVAPGGIAEEAGLADGDTVVAIDGTSTDTWMEMYEAIQGVIGEGPFTIAFEREGVPYEVTTEIGAGMEFGITAPVEVIHLNPIDAARVSMSYVADTATSIMRMFNPAHTQETLDNSSSIVGISVLSARAAAQGPTTFLTFAALISFSLGLMNLLPIPPLDGGKLVIEAIQAVVRRELPIRAQVAVSYAGMALFLGIFLYVLRNDIVRFLF